MDTRRSAPTKLYFGYNDQGEGIGTQMYKLSNFNIYESLLTIEDAKEIYEATKPIYTETVENSLEYKGVDARKALLESPSISVEFNNYIIENYSDKVKLLDANNEEVGINISHSEKNLIITPKTTFDEGDYTLVLSKDLTSYNGYTLGTDLNIPIELKSEPLFTLDVGDTITDTSVSGMGTLTVGNAVEVGSFINLSAQTVKYIQFKNKDGNNMTDKIDVDFSRPIASDSNGKADDITVEFWANISDTTGYENGSTKVFGMLADTTEVLLMQTENGGINNRYAVNKGGVSDLYLGDYMGEDVVDTWAHYVITMQVTDSQTSGMSDYTTTVYVNGKQIKTNTQTAQATLDAINKLCLGHFDEQDVVNYKLASFDVYKGIKKPDWIAQRYNDTASVYETKNYFADGPVFMELDTISQNLLLKGAKAEIHIKNEFNTNKPYTVYIAGYDKDGRLVEVVSSEPRTISGATDRLTLKYTASNDNVKEVKAFAWFKDLTPLTDAKEDDVFTVALVGDSITHRTAYSRAIETYYMTRYPDKKIEILNKGINGHSYGSAITRFDWDILNEEVEGLGEKAELTNRPDALTVMFGANDIGNYLTLDEAGKQRQIALILTNAEAFIQRCIEEKLDLTIITPVLINATPAEWGDGVDLSNFARNEGLKRVTAGLKELHSKYAKGGAYNSVINIGLVDMWTFSTELTQEVRDKDTSIDVVMKNNGDNVHPTVDGGFVMGYYFIKENAESPYVANVEIDASNATVTKADNADVKISSANSSGVTYTYLAKALPLPAHSSYIYAEETLKLPVTEDLNREIIKVTGLADGKNYSITMDGVALSKTYTAAELAAGVNIATDANNPAQIAAMNAYKEIEKKVEIEYYYRMIAQNFASFVTYYPGAYTYDELKSAMERTWVNDPDRLTTSLNELDNYFGKTVQSGNWIYTQKPNQQAAWDLMQGYINNARTYATPTQHTVVISVAN